MQNLNLFSFLLTFCIIIFTGIQITSASGDWAGEAKELMNSGEYDKALDIINAALSSGESKDLCYIQRANVYKKMGEYQKAIDDYNNAISLNPAMPYYLAMKGDVYVLMGEYQKGIDLYDSALQKNLGYEPLVQSVKSSREEAYQKMRDAAKSETPSQIGTVSSSEESKAEDPITNRRISEQSTLSQPLPAGSITSPPVIEWQKVLGGSGDNIGNSIIPTNDKGFILTGYSDPYHGDKDFSGNHGGKDVLVVKFDSSGEIEWYKCLGGSNNEEGFSIIQTNDGGYILSGWSGSIDGDVSGNHGDGEYGMDAWVVKLTDTGEIEWEKCYGGTKDDFSSSIIETSDGNYIFTGKTVSNNGDVSGNHGGSDFWVVKLNRAGKIIWQKCFGSGDDQRATSIIEASQGGYVIIGVAADCERTVIPEYHGNDDIWVVRISDDGSVLWQKNLGGKELDEGYSIVETSDMGFILTGRTCSNDGDVSVNHGLCDLWVVKLSGDGRFQWEKTFGGTEKENGQEIIRTSDGGYLISGWTYSNNGIISGNHGEHDVWIIKLTQDGTIQWQKCYGGSKEENAISIIENDDGNYIFTGYTFSSDGDVVGETFYCDVWVVKLSSKGDNLSQTTISADSNTGSLSISTTPSGAQVTLDGSLQSGQTPLTLSNIGAGSHCITFSKSGYLDVSMTVPVMADETSEFSISLSPDSDGVTTTTTNTQQKQPEYSEESKGEDLIVGEITLVYYKADSNDLNTDLTIKNIGTAPTSRFAITYFLSPEQIQDPFMDPNGKEIKLDRDEINALGPGETREASTMKIFSVYDIPPGSYWFGVFVDSQNSIAETDERNNVLYWEEQIKI